ncbi:hypothetical protein [Micromonospora sp. NPDC004704]
MAKRPCLAQPVLPVDQVQHTDENALVAATLAVSLLREVQHSLDVDKKPDDQDEPVDTAVTDQS